MPPAAALPAAKTSRTLLLAASIAASLAVAGTHAQSNAGVRQGRASDAELTVVLKLSEDPVAVVRGRARGRRVRAEDEGALVQDLRRRQDALVPQIEARGARVLAHMQHAINGIKVRGTADQIAALARLPGVVEVKPVATYEIDNARSVPFIGAPAVWGGIPGFHGEHIKVAVIDTGIDYTHANFGGPGTTAAFSAAAAAATGPADPALFGPSAPKVKGGTDLVGDSYNAGGTPAQQIPSPDPNPLDCAGHGSHVAGTIAGFGVLPGGSTYTGPYDAITPSQNFYIGPGVAPLADLYAVRVFGCTGSTNVVTEAIDWAVANNMQVVSMSLGSNFGPADSSDAEASTNAANAGIIVVAASGNAGPVPFVTSSPAAGDKVVSVAAMDSTSTFPAVNAATSGGAIALQSSNGAQVTNGTTLSVFVLRNPDSSVSFGCSESEYVDALIVGKLVVVQRGSSCARIDRATFGQRHGAAAVALINNSPGYPPFEGVIAAVTIPFLGVLTANGPTLIGTTTATLTNSTLTNPTFENFASFSSTGPRNRDAALKPDVTGPGVSIFSTFSGSGNLGEYMSGTSMATPHVSGVAALALQAHPTWDPDDVRLAVVNTADPTQLVGYLPRLGGAGLVQPFSATRTSVVARGDSDSGNLSFGSVEFASDFHRSGHITVRNLGSANASFTVNATAAPLAVGSAAHTAVATPASLSLAPGQTGVVQVDLTIPVATTGNTNAYREVSGTVTLRPATSADNNGVALTVPYLAAPRPRSAITTSIPNGFGPSGTTSATATSTNSSSTITGTADYYAWGLSGTHADIPETGIRAVGAEAFTSSFGLLVQFAVNTYTPWNQFTHEFDVYIDNNNDGVYDYVAYTSLLTTGTNAGRVEVFAYNLTTNTSVGRFLTPFHTGSSTLLMPVLLTDVGVTGRFTYSIVSFNGFTGEADAVPGTAMFNPFASALSTASFATLGPGASASVPLSINATEWPLSTPRGVMVVTRDNFSGPAEAQLIAVPTLSGATLRSIVVSPSTSSIVVGQVRQLTATGQYGDGTSQDLTTTVAWSSSSPGVSVSTAGLATANSAGGPVTMTATQGAVSKTASITVAKGATTMSRTANLGSSVAGQAVAFTGTVLPVPPASGTPTGAATLLDGTTAIATVALSSGSVTFTTTALPAGLHAISIRYGGDANYNASSSTAFPLTVGRSATTTSIVADSLTPVFGQPVTFTSTVSPTAPGGGTPTGTATFFDGATSLGSAPLSGGSASIATSALATGGHSITAQFNGDANFSSSGSAALALTVGRPPITAMTVTPDRPAPQPPGTTIMLTVAATGGTAPVQFKWWVFSATGWTVLQEWSAATSINWTPATANAAGMVEVWARSAGSPADTPEKYVDLPYAITQATGPIIAVAITPDRPSPQPPGTTVTLTATVTGGTAPYQFKWWVYSATGWTVLLDWNASANAAWTPATANPVGTIEVWVRSAGNSANAPEKWVDLPYAIQSALTVTADVPAPQPPGTTITLTAVAAGGTPPYQFKWWVYSASGWMVLRDWDPSATVTWTPATANPVGKVEVWTRSAGNTVNAPEQWVDLPYAIQSPLTVTADVAAPRSPGTSITLTATATGGTPPYQFKWWVYSATGWTVLQDWNASASYVWTPTTTNPLAVVEVWMRSAGNSANAPEHWVDLPYAIQSPLTVTADVAAPQHSGMTITLTANTAGGTPQFKWWVYSATGWTVLQDWNTSASYAWTPSTADPQGIVEVWRRRAGNSADAPEEYADLPFPILP